MKLYLVLMFLLFSCLLSAQRVSREKEKSGEWNIAKINLSALATGTLSFQFERALNNKVSLAIATKFRPSAGLPFKSVFKSFLDTLSEGAAIDFVNNAKIGGFAITPEVRFYLGKGSMHGFYIAPFVRYEQNNLTAWRYTFTAPSKTIVIDFTGKQRGLGAGLQLGAHYLLTPSISLDLWIAGPYLFYDKIDVNSVTDLTDKTDQELQEVKADIVKYAQEYLKGHTVEATVSKNGATLNARGTAPGIRALGVAVGFRF